MLAMEVSRDEVDVKLMYFERLGSFFGFNEKDYEDQERALNAYKRVLHEGDATDEQRFIERTISDGGSCRGSLGSDEEFTSSDGGSSVSDRESFGNDSSTADATLTAR